MSRISILIGVIVTAVAALIGIAIVESVWTVAALSPDGNPYLHQIQRDVASATGIALALTVGIGGLVVAVIARLRAGA